MALDIGAFLGGHVGPVPVWLIVGVGGVGAAFLLPKLLGSFGGSSAAAPTDTGAAIPSDSGGLPPAPRNGPPGSPPINQPPPRRPPAMGVFGKPPQPSIGPQSEPGGGIRPIPPRREPPQSVNPPVGPPGESPEREPPAGRTPPGRTPPGRTPPEREPPAGRTPPGRTPPQGGGSGPMPPIFVHPAGWPATDSTLSGLAHSHAVPLGRLQQLNPWIHAERGTWDSIFPADEIRIA